jgi:hypothetical protein
MGFQIVKLQDLTIAKVKEFVSQHSMMIIDNEGGDLFPRICFTAFYDDY